jgi:hypothetical protein
VRPRLAREGPGRHDFPVSCGRRIQTRGLKTLPYKLGNSGFGLKNLLYTT